MGNGGGGVFSKGVPARGSGPDATLQNAEFL